MSIEFVSYMTKAYNKKYVYNINIVIFYNKFRNKPDDYKIEYYMSILNNFNYKCYRNWRRK